MQSHLLFSLFRGRMQGGGDINSALGILPDKLKTELALHVNLKTLKKVSIESITVFRRITFCRYNKSRQIKGK